jgi:hypothetical protein
VWRVRAQWTGGIGGPYLTTTYFDDIAGTAPNANAALGAFLVAVRSLVSTTISMATLSQVDQVDATTGHVTSSVGVTPVSTTGTGAGDVLPPASQGLCQLFTGVYLNGRQVRGRLFLPGMLESNSTLGVPTAGSITTVNGALAAFIADANSVWGVYSRRNHDFNTISSAIQWTTWAQLRSRRS